MLLMDRHAIIDVRGLVKDFAGFRAVDDVSFSVNRAQIFGFLGPNGAGKTTTIKMLTTVLRPTKGTIAIDGHDVARDPRGVRRSFGIVFQDPSLDDELTARENMELHAVLYGVPRAERTDRTEALLRFVDLWDRRDDYVKRFSGGMKRRLEIGRALLHGPKIIFLDEPTSGLDPQTRNHIWSYISRLRKETALTVFFTTHYMEEAERVADEIAIIDRGKIVAQGSPSELKTRTQSGTLEEAFIALTGHAIREEDATAADRMRLARRVWRGGR